MMKAAALLLLANIACSLCLTIPQDAAKPTKDTSSAKSLLPSCENTFDLVCLKLSFVSFLDRMSLPSEISLVPGFSIVSDGPAEDSDKKLQEIARSYPDDPAQQVDDYLAYKIASFVENHSIKVEMVEEENARGITTFDNEVDLTEEGRRKRRKKKKLIKLLGIAGLFKFAFKKIIEKVIFGVMLLIAFVTAKKALILSKLALIAVLVKVIGAPLIGLITGAGGADKKADGVSGSSAGGSSSSWGGSPSSSSSWGGSPSSSYGAPQEYSGSSGGGGGGYARKIEFTLPERLAKQE